MLFVLCDYSKPIFWLDQDIPIADQEQRIQFLEQQIQNLKNDILSLADALEKDENMGSGKIWSFKDAFFRK